MLSVFIACGLGSLVSVAGSCLHCLRKRNPYRFPLTLYGWLVFPRLALLVFGWWLGSIVVYNALCLISPVRLTFDMFGEWPPALLLGGLLPQLTHLNEFGIQEALPNWLKPFMRVFVRLSEATHLYTARTLKRIERRENERYGSEEYRLATERLYEQHVREIVLMVEAHAKHPGRAPGLLRKRNRAGQFELLLRLLGYSRLVRRLREVRQHPLSIFPTWPPSVGNRRGKRPPGQTKVPEVSSQLRRTDDPTFFEMARDD